MTTRSALGGRAVYPGTFDPLTPGHLDIIDRARRLFGHVTVLVASNRAKTPAMAPAARAAAIREALPNDWDDVDVTPWEGLTATYCAENDVRVIVRGVRSVADIQYEYELAGMNESLGTTTVLLPARPHLAPISSTAVRLLGRG
ncbi:pantetheine-phosphate adenylyltransferase [Micromonospora coxensis]|uniref:Pantetheine-phosphate adenylyltransferase n=1 Tax=Micromonospora coxensis TaxID=356852 RepID=A0A1C5JXM6_9ACTN|nr:pantetheine-phosphate adenylyltransferase [Micromonospora coxensis]SCG75344.1 Phosphopantetheine adenylyltransferase [Micromonospora coxensis]